MRLDYDPGADMDEPRACRRCCAVVERAEMVEIVGRMALIEPGQVLVCRQCYGWIFGMEKPEAD